MILRGKHVCWGSGNFERKKVLRKVSLRLVLKPNLPRLLDSEKNIMLQNGQTKHGKVVNLMMSSAAL